MPPPICDRRRRRWSPPELVFRFSPEGRQRDEAFYLSLDGNAEYEELLERDRLAEEQRIADFRHQRDMEQRRIDALSREQSARNWADYMEAGARQIALEAVGHARVCDADFYYQLVKWVSRLEAEASVDHAGMERANACEQRALSHLWQVRGEAQDAGASVQRVPQMVAGIV